MYNYEDLDNVSGLWPDVIPLDVTSPGAGDGTKVEATIFRQAWGFHQAIMDYVSLSPDDAHEVHDASQLLTALKEGLAPVGQIVAWHGAADPDTFSNPSVRLLQCEGQVVATGDYPELTDRCYVGDANCTDPNFYYWYKSTDAGGVNRSTSGTYLKVADLRGAFLRGRDTTAIRDPQGAARELPDVQNHALHEHEHEVQTLDTSFYLVDTLLNDGSGSQHNYFVSSVAQTGARVKAETITGDTPDAVETRPINVNVVWCVRY